MIIDRDFVEPVNLQRQALFTESDAEQSLPKAIAARDHLQSINGEVEIIPIVADLNDENISLLTESDLILDGTDNFQTRYLLNDAAWKYNIPWIYGACVAASGVACAFVPESFPCLRCIFENEPPPGSAPTCDTAGIIWPAVGLVVSYQTSAAFKILTHTSLKPELLQADLWESRYSVISLAKAKRADCLTCGTRNYPSLEKRTEFETALCGRDAVQIKPGSRGSIELDAIQKRWDRIGKSSRNPFLLKLILDENEIVLFPDGRAIIKGTNDISRARDLYAKYVGI
jgi:adenylyltransferase/sulfurtransferase